MDILKAILTLLAAAAKPPDFSDQAATKAWLDSLTEPAATLLAVLTSKKVGALPTDMSGIVPMAVEELAAEGKIDATNVSQWIQAILAILALFKKGVTPAPEPAPAPPVV